MLTQLGASLVGLFDSIMVGHYGTADLAAVSFSNAIFFTIMVFSMGAIMGLTPIVGQLFVQNKHEEVAGYLFNGFIFTLVLIVLSTVILASAIPFLHLFGQEQEVIIAAKPYYTLIVISIVPFLFFCLFRQFLEGLGNTIAAMLITIGTNLLNIFLNWIFIFGHWGFEPMGAKGAGIATLIARLLMPLLFFIVIAAKKEWRIYLTIKSSIAKDKAKELTRLGIPIGLQTLLETITFTLSFVMVGWISKESLAAHQVANQIADMTFMLALGIGAATTIRVSHQLGVGDLHAVKMASNASIHLVLLMNAIGATLMISLRNFIPKIFTNDPAVIEIASVLILCAGLFQFADGLQCVGAAMLRGIKDVKMPMVYAFIAYILIALPIGAICMFPLHLGAKGMWFGFIFGLAAAAIFFHTRFRRKLAQLNKNS